MIRLEYFKYRDIDRFLYFCKDSNFNDLDDWSLLNSLPEVKEPWVLLLEWLIDCPVFPDLLVNARVIKNGLSISTTIELQLPGEFWVEIN